MVYCYHSIFKVMCLVTFAYCVTATTHLQSKTSMSSSNSIFFSLISINLPINFYLCGQLPQRDNMEEEGSKDKQQRKHKVSNCDVITQLARSRSGSVKLIWHCPWSSSYNLALLCSIHFDACCWTFWEVWKCCFLLFHWASFQATFLSLLFFSGHIVLCKSGKVPEIHTLQAPMFSLYILSISYLAPRYGYFSNCAHVFSYFSFHTLWGEIEVLHGKPGMLPIIRGYHLTRI